MLKDVCKMCEEWNGEEHDYSVCDGCAAAKMQAKIMQLEEENKRLKEEIKSFGSKLSRLRELETERSWTLSQERMGR